MNTKVLLVISLAALIFISCGKDAETVTVKNGSAKITGVAKCELDMTNTEREYVPSGTKIIATINTSDLVTAPDANINYPQKTFTTTVGANGAYTLAVDANAKTVNVTITASDFEYDKKINDTTYTRTVYSLAPNGVTVIDGITKINDLNFN